jgi:hypothetical protein
MSQGIKASAELKALVLQDYSQGVPHKEVAEKYGISHASVSNYIKEAGLGRKKYWTSEEIDYAVNAYSTGATIQEISTYLKRNRLDVSKKLRRQGIAIEKGSVRTQRVKDNPFQDLTNPQVQYWLGWLASDGCVSDKGQVILTSCKDPQILDEYVAFLGCGVGVLTSPQRGRKELKYFVEFSSQKVATYLQSLGITARKSLTLKMSIPITWDFIRGYYDGNGSLRTGVKSFRLTWHTASPLFKDQLLEFFTENGANAGLAVERLNHPKYKPVYRVTLRNVEQRIIGLLYPEGCIHLERKKPHIIKPNTEDIV